VEPSSLPGAPDGGCWGWLGRLPDLTLEAGASLQWSLPPGLVVLDWFAEACLLTVSFAPDAPAMPPLAFGLTPAGADRVLWAGRLNRLGQASFPPPGEGGAFRLHFTPHVRAAIDVEVLRTIGGARSAAQLRTAEEDDSLPGELRWLAIRARPPESSRPGRAAVAFLGDELQRLIASFAPGGVPPEQFEARAVVDALVRQALGARLSSLSPAERLALYDSAALAYHEFLLRAEGRAADTDAMAATTAALTQRTQPGGAKEQALLAAEAALAQVYRLHKYAGRSVEAIAELLGRDAATVAALLEHAGAYVAS
jgi:hypothetical protein